jgi:hypothetical protein
MRKHNKLNGLIARTVGSNAALLRAMRKSSTPISDRTLYNWLYDAKTIKLQQLINLSKAMNIPVCELIKSITIKHEGDE